MPKQNNNRILPLLESLASDWSSGRGCVVRQGHEEGSEDQIKVDGPGFLYRWDDNSDPVLVSFLPDGAHRIAPGNHHQLLVIGVAKDGLFVQLHDRRPHLIRTSALPLQQQLHEIIKEAQCSAEAHRPGPCEKLSTVTAAQRLVVLGHAAHESCLNGKNSSKFSTKNRFVTELHDWLAGELENSVKLRDAARHFSKSPRQLIRVLKETTGSGFAEHLTIHRLLLARTLLMRTDTSIMEVAKKSGFNSREQFIRSFSKAFSWTPLQYRKAWNKASLSNSDLRELCQISEREPVEWLPHEQTASTNLKDEPAPNTLVVANALHEITELFSVDPSGNHERVGLLDRGSMTFINRSHEGSQWLVRIPGTGFVRGFVTPDQHAIAVISPDVTRRSNEKGRELKTRDPLELTV